MKLWTNYFCTLSFEGCQEVITRKDFLTCMTQQGSFLRIWTHHNVTSWKCERTICSIVTLCRWPAKQTIPLSVLARNQTKGFGLEISPCPEVVTGREKRVGQRSSRRELATGHGQGQSTVDTGAERRVGMRESPDQWRRSSQDESAFQLLCGIFASVSLYMLSEMQCCITPLLHLS